MIVWPLDPGLDKDILTANFSLDNFYAGMQESREITGVTTRININGRPLKVQFFNTHIAGQYQPVHAPQFNRDINL